MKIIAATKNQGKLNELTRIIKPFGFEVVSSLQAGADIDVKETGTTFKQNAFLKARTIYEATGTATIADDSGLEVEFLNNRPGVYSARYAGENASDKQNIEKLLDEMKNIQSEHRAARFVCVICYIDQHGNEHYAQGTCNGYIGLVPIGTEGFGYDPVFMVGEKSFAQLTPKEKDLISHRGRALKQLKDIIESGKK